MPPSSVVMVLVTGVGFGADADNNLIAGTNAASSVYNPASCTACDNVIMGTSAGCKLTSGCSNVLIGNRIRLY